MSGVTAGQVEALCEAAGMGRDDPLRAGLVGLAHAAEDLRAAADRIGREAAGRAATAAVAECRQQMARVAREVAWIRRLAVAGLVLVAAGGGWWAGQRMPQPMPLGRLTPAQAETLRWNDLGALLEGCQRGAPQSGREWCGFTRGWWLSPPPAPATRSESQGGPRAAVDGDNIGTPFHPARPAGSIAERDRIHGRPVRQAMRSEIFATMPDAEPTCHAG